MKINIKDIDEPITNGERMTYALIERLDELIRLSKPARAPRKARVTEVKADDARTTNSTSKKKS